MVSKKIKTSTESFICWLCGFIHASKVGLESMRDMECPNCKLKSAFVPKPISGV